MRLKTRIWFLLSLVLFLAAAFFWRLGNQQSARRQSAAPTGGPAAVAPPFVLNVTNFVTATNSSAPQPGPLVMVLPPNTPLTNRFAYRLSNTKQPFGELLHNEHAVLLRNALIDTTLVKPLEIPEHLRAKGDPGSYIVQSRGPITQAFRDWLTQSGAEIISYVPNNAYLVRASAEVVRNISTSPATQTLLTYEPYYKLDARLLPLAVRQDPSPYGVMNVVAFPGATESVKQQLEQIGAAVLGASEPTVFGDILAIKAPAMALVAVSQIKEVQMVAVHSDKRPVNDLSRVKLRVSTNTLTRPAPSHYAAPTPSDYLTGRGVLVAVADTGVDENHPDLTGRIEPGSVTTDFDGHGTHVIGSLLGDGTASPLSGANHAYGSTTGAIFSGIAPRAQAYVQDLYRPNSELQQNTALKEALISNNSWGLVDDNDYDITAASYDAAVRDSLPGVTGEQEVAYVFAAGNDGGGGNDGLNGIPGSVLSPATAKNVITVGAVDQARFITNQTYRACDTNGVNCETNQPWLGMTDSDNQVSGYSARGNVGIGVEGVFGRFKPDVVAPGSMVVSARSASYEEPNGSTNTSSFQYNSLPFSHNTTNLYSLNIPAQAVSVTILLLTNALSPPTNVNLFIGADIDDIPTSFIASNSLTLDKTTSPALKEGTLNYIIANLSYPNTAIFDLVVLLTVTNDVGNKFEVLRQINEPLKPSYRYESGTSMAAPKVSGMLALMQEYLGTNFSVRPSPALLKALLINGARSLSLNYNLSSQAAINHQGWGLANISNSIPSGLVPSTTNGPMRFFDQNITNALTTGGTHVYEVTVPDEARSYPLRITLVWSDSPGNPITTVKLVNDLNLSVAGVVTNTVGGTSNTSQLLWLGNNFGSGSDFSSPITISSTDTNANVATNLQQSIEMARDTVNNVENVYLRPPLSGSYTVTVKGHRVNVNAVNSHSNNIVQDYALVIASGNVAPSNNVNLLVSGPVFTNDPGSRISALAASGPATSNGPVRASLFDQRVGANSALIVSTNGATNQWCFFSYTNVNDSTYTNVVILTFLAPNLSLPRHREADIDLYVTRSTDGTGSGLFLLDPVAVSAATKSTGRGGTELVFFTNAQAGEVFSIGVKSEDQQAANFAIYAESRNSPFSSRDASNNIIASALGPVFIPDGSPDTPGGVMLPAFILDPRDSEANISRVYVTNAIFHEEAGDLVGILSQPDGGPSVVLNNHRTWTGWENPVFPYGVVYDDSGLGDLGDETSTPPVFVPDGPGQLLDFLGELAGPSWFFTVSDNAFSHTGLVQEVTLVIEPSSTNSDPNVVIDRVICVPPGAWRYEAVNVDSTVINMEICVSDFSTPVGSPIGVYVRQGSRPDFGNYDYLFGVVDPGACFDIGLGDTPPLVPGRWWIGYYNSNSTVACFHERVTFSRTTVPGPYYSYYSQDTPMKLLDDAVTNSTISVTSRGKIADLRVGLRVEHERASDLVFHLTSPSGTRLLLAENRGRTNVLGYGAGILQTNVLPTTDSGGAMAATNVVDTALPDGIILIRYDFLAIPDRMTIYYEGNQIFDSQLISGAGNFSVPFGPGSSTNLTIIMNEGDNPEPTTVWNYTATIITGYIYTTFTENTNLTDTPIKFGIPPFTNGGFGGGMVATQYQDLYFNDFQGAVGPEWSPATTGVSSTGIRHLGKFGNDTLIFNYTSNQPPHQQIEVSFDLYMIDSWDGNPPWTTAGPDIWDWKAWGTNVLHTTFANFPNAPYFLRQSYPDQYPAGDYPGQTDAVGIGNIGYSSVDAVYHITRTFEHTNGSIQMNFSAVGLQGIADESWGIDNFRIRTLQFTTNEGAGFYLPEEPLKPIFGEQTFGDWALEIWDSRLGAALAGTPQLLSWKLEIGFVQTNPPVILMTNGSIFTTNIVGRGVVYFAVDLPCSSGFVTNTLACFTTPSSGLRLMFNQDALPTKGPSDVLLLSAVTGTSNAVLSIGTPPLVSAARYYLAVYNENPAESNQFRLSINARCTPPPIQLTNGISYCEQLPVGGFEFYDYLVSTGATSLRLETLLANGNVDMYVRQALNPTLASYDYRSINGGTNNELVLIGTNSPVPLSPGRWSIAITNRSPIPVSFCVRATETIGFDVITNIPGEFFTTNSIAFEEHFLVNFTDTNLCRLAFYLFVTAGDVDLYYRDDTWPTTNYFQFSSTNAGTVNEFIGITNSPVSVGNRYLTVVHRNPMVPVTYSFFAGDSGCGPVPQILVNSASYTPSQFTLRWVASPGNRYQVQYTDQLGPATWQTVPTTITSGGSLYQFIDDGLLTGGLNITQRFYRLIVLP